MKIKPIHMIKEDGKFVAASITICGKSGRNAVHRPEYYKTMKDEFFRAVLPSDMKQGATCEKCRTILKMKREKS